MLDIVAIMKNISNVRSVFHSEKDFQHAFAWRVHELLPHSKVRLECRPVRELSLYADILVEAPPDVFVIELKYHTRRLAVDIDGEQFDLRNQGAHPMTRYHFISDIARIEAFTEAHAATCGYAIFLTNDPLFWTPPTKLDGIDRSFVIHEAARLAGTLRWSEGSATGRRPEVSTPIALRGTHAIRWYDYSTVTPSGLGRFKYTYAACTRT